MIYRALLILYTVFIQKMKHIYHTHTLGTCASRARQRKAHICENRTIHAKLKGPYVSKECTQGSFECTQGSFDGQYFMSCCVLFYHAMLGYALLCWAALMKCLYTGLFDGPYVALCYVVLSYVQGSFEFIYRALLSVYRALSTAPTLRYVILYYLMSCWVMSCYVGPCR